jgi:hypothetical protein
MSSSGSVASRVVRVCPIRFETLRENTSSDSVETGSKAPNSIGTAVGSRKSPVTQRARPEATGSLLRESSTRRSNAAPESPLFFSPTHRTAGPRAVNRLAGVARASPDITPTASPNEPIRVTVPVVVSTVASLFSSEMAA